MESTSIYATKAVYSCYLTLNQVSRPSKCSLAVCLCSKIEEAVMPGAAMPGVGISLKEMLSNMLTS